MIFPGKPITSVEEYMELKTRITKPKESRVVTIERFETFLFELHRAMRSLPFPESNYPELVKFLEKNSK